MADMITVDAHTPSPLWPLPQGIDAAIFDFDGTLAETSWVWRLVDEHFFERRGLPYTSEVSRELAALGFAPGARFVIQHFGLDEREQDICDEWNADGRELYEHDVRLRLGAEEYLHALRAAGVPIALATTNAPEVIDAMCHVDADALFDERVHGCEVSRPKHFPDIYVEAARRLGVEPSHCIVFEDLAVGLRSARSVGMLGVGVRCDDECQDLDALRAQSDILLNDWRDIRLG